MAKHGRKNDVTATSSNPVIRALRNAEVPKDATRLAKDIAILDNGWNNTEEGQTDLMTGGASRPANNAKHKK